MLVAFEHGQFDRPFVIGGLWNGKDKPPAEAVKGGQVQTRMLRTRAGHHISLHDDDSAGKIELKTGKHTVVLDDSSQGKVEVKSGKHTVTLDDSGQGRIEITSGSQKIVLDNSGPGKISIEAGAMLEIKGAGGKLSITPAGVELSATGILTLRGTIVNIN